MREREATSSKSWDERREERGGFSGRTGWTFVSLNGLDSRVEISSRPTSFVASRVLDNSDKE